MGKLFTDEEREEMKSIITELVADGTPPMQAQKDAAKVIVDAADAADPDPTPDLGMVALEAQQKALSDQMNALIKQLEDAPAIKNAGYISVDGGAADPDNKSLGDFFLAVKRNDVKRLTSIYKSHSPSWAKDIQSQDGPAGGYLIPEQYHAQLMEVAGYGALVRPRAQIIPVMTDSGKMPVLNQGTAPTAGQGDTAFAGGVVAGWTSAGGSISETQPTFEQVSYVIQKIAGYTEVENEALADSPLGIEALLTRLFGTAVRNMEEFAFLRGDGAAEPLGILNAAAAIAVTTAGDNAFVLTDVLAIKARFKGTGGQPVWGIHPGMWPDIGKLEISTGSSGVWQANLGEALGNALVGWPLIESEHLPQDDNAGDVLLADFSAYVIWDRAQMAVAFSEHAAFTTDKSTWRFVKRLDGAPWLSNAITLADPQGSYTVSPFVYHND